jgi:hemolysin III
VADPSGRPDTQGQTLSSTRSPASTAPVRSLSVGEEIANSVTHGLALLASLVGLPVLIVVAASRGDAWQIAGAALFGATLVLLYSASTLYHALPPSRAKRVFRVLDHAAIYLLIAGTYTPFALGALRGSWGWTLLGTIWTLAGAGIALKASLGFRFARASTAVYLLMGWLALVAVGPLASRIGAAGVAWLLAGGLSYTAGVLFFAWGRLRYAHAVWHLFVAAGSVCHFFAVLWYAGTRAGLTLPT